jgi:uncharacterized RDD family membrane protein YckC
MARVTQPSQQPGQKPEDAGLPSGEQAARAWYQATAVPPDGQPAPGSGPPTMPLSQPDYGNPAREAQAAPGDAPAQPGSGIPAQPAGGTQPGGGTRPLPSDWAQAGYRTQVGYGSPGQPGYGTQAAYGTQGRPGYGVQPQPGYGTQGGYGSPAQQPYGYGTHQAYPGSTYQYGSGQYGSGKDPSLAEWWQRLLARIIDAAVILVLASPFWLPPFATYVRRIQDVQNLYQGDISNPAAQTAISVAGSRLFGSLVLAGIAGALIAMAYDWIQHGLWGKTLGKRAVGTMVVTADTRSKIGGGAAGGRAAVYALPSAVPIVGALFAAVNELWLLWDKRRQCLHDKAARTVVIKTKGPGGSPAGQRGSLS